MEIKKTTWLEDFEETCQDIMEDAFLLDALAVYVSIDEEFTRGVREDYLPQVYRRLSNYLFQHALELHRLEKRLGLEG